MHTDQHLGPEIMLMGGLGGMAGCLRRQLPATSRIADLQNLGSERRVRRVVARFMRNGHGTGDPQLERVLFCSVPQTVYTGARSKPGPRARLIHLLGTPGAGQSGTLLVPCASLLAVPTEVMSASAGPVIGLHLLYAPTVSDLSRETAILCAPQHTRRHHLYASALVFLHALMRDMGHGIVLELAPESHDKLMADVQFLSHSMFLCIALATRDALGSTAYDPARVPQWLDDALQVAQRILAQPAHVYAGIATGNPHNQEVADRWFSAINALRQADIESVVRDAISVTATVSAEYREAGDLPRSALLGAVSTPVSRYREHLAATIVTTTQPHDHNSVVSMTNAVASYRRALYGHYENWFQDLAEWFPERHRNRAAELIAVLPMVQ